MNVKNSLVKDNFYPHRQQFGNTLQGNDEVYFGEKMIVMHSDQQMLLQTIGDGAPYRLHNLRIGLYTEGEMDFQVNLEERHASRGTLEFFSQSTLFQLNKATTDFRALEVIFDSSYLLELLDGIMPPLFSRCARSLSVELASEEYSHFCEMMHLLLYLAHREGELAPVTRAMAQTILRYSLSLFAKHTKTDRRSLSRREIIFNEFARLVTLSRGRQRKHSYYANQLNVSEHYLSLAVKESSGVSAKEWIDRVVMAEIKLMLVHSDLTVSEIAAKLDFPSDSFLCKFFRRHSDMSPIEFRRSYK